MRIAGLGLAIAVCAAVQPARAEDPASQAAKPKNDAPKKQHLFGDWGGLRSRLHDEGVDLTFGYTGETAAVVSGGKRHGIDYAQQLELQADLDWDKIAGLKGFKTHTIFVNRAGRSAAHDFAGDDLFQIESIYGGTHHAPIHLVEFWAEQKLGRADLAGGRLAVGEDFATSPLYCMFMSTTLCGYPHSLPAKVGFSAFPNSTWGARLRVDPGSRLYLQGGAYQVRPKLGGRWGFGWGFSGTTGTYFPLEIGWEPEFGNANLPGHYKAGFAIDTSDYPDQAFDAQGRPYVLSGASPRTHGSRHSWYMLADQMLRRNGEGGTNGLILVGGYVRSAPATSLLTDFAFAGVVDQGLIPGRPDDTAGLMVAHVKASDRVRLTQSLEQEMDLPLTPPAPGPQRHETVIEAQYRIAIGPGVQLMPDIQYIIRPSASSGVDDALALGLRAKVTF